MLKDFDVTTQLILSLVLIVVILVAIGGFLYNLYLLYKFRQRSFFRKRNINLILLTIIPSAFYAFVLVPTTYVLMIFSQKVDIIWLLMHVSALNFWVLSIVTRFWYLFISIRRAQDSLAWKKVCVKSMQ